jgi:TolB-like protein
MRARLTAVLVTFLLFCGGMRAQQPGGVVLLPLDNISGAKGASELVRQELVAGLARNGWSVIENEAIEQVLERHRVRYMDSITDDVRSGLTSATGASALMLVSILTFRGGESAVVTLSARLIAADGSLLWSNIDGAHADQTEPLFGGPNRRGPSDVAREAVAELTRNLPRPGDAAKTTAIAGSGLRRRDPVSFVARELVADRKPRICVLPFDSNSEVPEAALVLANAFAVRLAAAGNFDVVEPADVRAASVKANIGSFRSLGSPDLARLGKAVGTSLFLRGTISKYVDTPARYGTSPPEIELDLFLVDVDAGSVLWSASHARSGADYVGLLLLGGIVDGATLADRAVCELAVAERQGVRRNTEWAASHPRHTQPERRQLLATTARKD